MTQARSSKIDFEIVIVGGGLVGSALACALGNRGRSVLVLESGNVETEISSNYDLRVSAITGASRNFFRSIGAWQDMQALRMGQVREMEIWDEGGSGSLHLDAAETGEDCLAYIVENSVIRAALYKRLKTLGNIDFRQQANVKLEAIDQDRVLLRVDGDIVATQLVVGADGARSVVRDWAEIQVSGWSFNQTAIVATIKTENSHNHTAYQRFLGTGPLAFLPLDDEHTSSIVWSADTDKARQLLSVTDDEFIGELTGAFQNRLGSLSLVSKRAAFPLALMQTDCVTQHRMVLVGDAAHRIHPLAGQGLNLGLADVASLAEVLNESCAEDAGSKRYLRQYERWRAGDTLLMVRLMDVFKRLYGSEQPLARGFRNFSMDLLAANSSMRKLISSFAAGVSGDTPASLRYRGA